MNKDHFQITALEALPDFRLRLTYVDGQSFDVSLQAWIKSTKALRALKDASLFAKAKIGEAGPSVDWMDGIDVHGGDHRPVGFQSAQAIGHQIHHEPGLGRQTGWRRVPQGDDRISR